MKFGSPSGSTERTFRLVFELPEKPKKLQPTPKAKVWRNPVRTAQEWLTLLENGTYSCYAELARAKGISPSRVTQVLKVLQLAPEVMEKIAALGDQATLPVITERKLRQILQLEPQQQLHAIALLTDKSTAEMSTTRGNRPAG